MKKPRIAVFMGENTSEGATHYKTCKNYFHAIAAAGGLPYGISYLPDLINHAVHEFDGLLSVGGDIEFPSDWHVPGHASPFPPSERLDHETQIMHSFLDADKPVLGACHGMQVLGCLNGCLLQSDAKPETHRNKSHPVQILEGTLLHKILGVDEIVVNSIHNEHIAVVGNSVRAAARAPDSTIEAIEIPGKKFALGYQWHQEDFWKENHPGNKIFTAFVASARDI